MKKKYVISLVLLAFAFISVSPAFAQDTVRDKRDRDAAATSTRKDKRIEIQQDVAKRKVEKTTEVINRTISRLEKIIQRAGSRIAKLKEAGGNTQEAEKFISEAKNHLALASDEVKKFKDIDLSSEKAQENFEKVRLAVRSAKEHIRMAHESLVKAVRSLGQIQSSIRSDRSGKATSTPDR